jgi:uncharacterized protein YndB with AHSA1/START domain
MRIRHQLKYDASPDQVYAMLADPGFRERVASAMDTVSHDVSVTPAGAGMAVRIDMVQHTRGVPGFAKKVVGDQTRVVQAERWADHRSAELELEIPGKPGHVRGTITLAEDGTGTVETFEGEVSVHIPLVGGKLEGVVEKLFVSGMDTEQRVGTAWLADAR